MAWSRHPDRYRGAPPSLADRIRRRDNNTCQQCGAPGHQVDHKVNTRSGGTNHPDNLRVLCDACHQAKTQQEARAGIRAWHRAHPARRPTEAHPGLVDGAHRTTTQGGYPLPPSAPGDLA